jgi:hypothetical protein
LGFEVFKGLCLRFIHPYPIRITLVLLL